jgi:hypothetical protein
MAPTPVNESRPGTDITLHVVCEQRDALLAALEAILASGIEHDDPHMIEEENRYKCVRIYHSDWEAAKKAVKRAKEGT